VTGKTGRTITLRLDERTCKYLETVAQAEDRDVAQQVRHFVRRGLEAWRVAQIEASIAEARLARREERRHEDA